MKDSPIPDMYDKAEDDSTILGRLASQIPGFDGYIERSRRREADQILRETISGRLEDSRLQLSNVQQELGRDIAKAMEYAEPLGRADTRLMGLIGKVNQLPAEKLSKLMVVRSNLLNLKTDFQQRILFVKLLGLLSE